MTSGEQAARTATPVAPSRAPTVSRIAAGVDGREEGRDAALLAGRIAALTGADLILAGVHPDPMIVLPAEFSWSALRKRTESMLREIRDADAPGARVVAETDFSVARALHRVVLEHNRDLLVVGSCREAADGHVRLGNRTRQLLGQFDCAIAVAPRGLHARGAVELRRIGVGFDAEPESAAALTLAGSLARRCDSELVVRCVVDDRVPVLLRGALNGLIATEWHDVVLERRQALSEQAGAALATVGVDADCAVLAGHPADVLLELSAEVDLLVIGSRRWGAIARLLLGSTGEALMHGAACPVLAVPRPGHLAPRAAP